jgi:ACR3 family arsenite efflux pump ArsB
VIVNQEHHFVKDTLPQSSTNDTSQEQAGPQGVGMAVAFDWGLAVQIFMTPVLLTFFGLNPIASGVDTGSTLLKTLSFVVTWPFAALLVWYGEMVRSGRNWARRVQVWANTLLTLAGLAGIVNLYRGFKAENFWPLVTEVILLIFSPLIAWRLSRPVTTRWFKRVLPDEARKRHGGWWIVFIAMWAIVGGILQAIAASK